MKKLSLLFLTVITASLLVACSDDKSASTPNYPIIPGGVPTPPPANDGFITWQSAQWNSNLANGQRFGQLLTGGTAGNKVCWSDGYYPSSGFREFFGSEDCENYRDQAFVMFRYNPTTNKAQIYVYGACLNSYYCGSGLVAGFSRESTASNQANGLYVDFGPLSTSGNQPTNFSSYRVYVSSAAANSSVTVLPIAVSFGSAPNGDLAISDNLNRVN